MPQDIRVKICGLRDVAMIDVAVLTGATYLGFVFIPRSVRALTIAQAAPLAAYVPGGIAKVALLLDPDDAELEEILTRVPIDMIQLHGDETPERVADVKARFGLPVMKAVGISSQADLAGLAAYARVADQILVDAKPPKTTDLPGGTGVPFDWSLIAGRRWPCPWMLAGGLTHENVADAIALTGARQVDVSSGVETAPGVKHAGLIARFMTAVRS
jgi:phosphoribosylanthranilate isomerase